MEPISDFVWSLDYNQHAAFNKKSNIVYLKIVKISIIILISIFYILTASNG